MSIIISKKREKLYKRSQRRTVVNNFILSQGEIDRSQLYSDVCSSKALKYYKFKNVLYGIGPFYQSFHRIEDNKYW